MTLKPFKLKNQKMFSLGKILFIINLRQKEDYDPYASETDYSDGMGFLGYVSWCQPSETIYFWKWEINIQNRRM